MTRRRSVVQARAGDRAKGLPGAGTRRTEHRVALSTVGAAIGICPETAIKLVAGRQQECPVPAGSSRRVGAYEVGQWSVSPWPIAPATVLM
jgi:hypothetical protein